MITFGRGIDDSLKLSVHCIILLLCISLCTRYITAHKCIPFLRIFYISLLLCLVLTVTVDVPCHDTLTVANTVTLMKVFVATFGVYNVRTFGKQGLWLSVLCGWSMNLIDEMDGPIARVSGCTSDWGNWLDHQVVDPIGEIYWFILLSVLFPEPRWIWDLVLFRTAITIKLGPWSPPIFGCIHWYCSWTVTLWTLTESIGKYQVIQSKKERVLQCIGVQRTRRIMEWRDKIIIGLKLYGVLLLFTWRFNECA